MSRSLGATSETSRSPIRILPASTGSRPASIRSVVDLPQPEGPTRTRNSPSPTSRSMASTAGRGAPGYCRVALSKVTVAMVHRSSPPAGTCRTIRVEERAADATPPQPVTHGAGPSPVDQAAGRAVRGWHRRGMASPGHLSHTPPALQAVALGGIGHVPIRIEDVARAAGVSTATVSRALRGLPSVSAETKQAVRQAAAELGYVVSRSASSLASGKTLTVGVVTPYVRRWYYATVIEAVERELRAVGYDALLVGVGESMTEDAEPFRAEVLRGRVDGLVILTAPLTGRELDGLRRLTVPMAFVGAGAPGTMSVRVDDLAVGR